MYEKIKSFRYFPFNGENVHSNSSVDCYFGVLYPNLMIEFVISKSDYTDKTERTLKSYKIYLENDDLPVV